MATEITKYVTLSVSRLFQSEVDKLHDVLDVDSKLAILNGIMPAVLQQKYTTSKYVTVERDCRFQYESYILRFYISIGGYKCCMPPVTVMSRSKEGHVRKV